MKHREFRHDGYRKCSVWQCDEMIGQCMGAVFAGDYVLALRGQIAFDQVRERCGSCQLHSMARRDGYLGLYVLAATKIYDIGRWFSWHLQMKFRRVKHLAIDTN